MYGKSKLAGEIAVASCANYHVILRTSWVCSPIEHNFVKTMSRFARDRDEVAVVDDQWGAPAFASDLAASTTSIGDKLASVDDRSHFSGIYRASSAGEATWCRLAREIMVRLAAKGSPRCRVRAIASREYPTRAKRPQNSRFDCSKLKRVFGLSLPRWQTSLETCLDMILDQTAGTSI